MFIGRYYHKLEEKGRLSLPKKFREQASHWVITRGLDGGLFVFLQTEFELRLRELEDRSFTHKHHRDFIRLMANDAHEVTTDRNGRVQLPEYLIELAGLDKEVVVVGSFSRVEIWDSARYHAYLATIEPTAESIAEQLNT